MKNSSSARIKRLIQMAPNGMVVQTKHVILPPLEDWFNDEGNLVLMGDALHVLNVCDIIFRKHIRIVHLLCPIL